ncbi:MAG: TetR/AcrR family transcriptional regulator [Longimicrobiales bacterium]
MDNRERILDAAQRLFGELGYRGTTTRRIADAAGVNEVTLFRHFGTKGELVREAVGRAGRTAEFPHLPRKSRDVREELVGWSRLQLAHLYSVRLMIRTVMGEAQERPELLDAARDRPLRVHAELSGYLARLQRRGLVAGDVDVRACAAMLIGALFSDAMGRDFMPEVFNYTMDEAPALYVDLLLRAIGGAERAV